MIFSEIIKHLREQCPIFKSMIGGVLDWTDNADLEQLTFKQLPCAFVLPEADEVSECDGSGGFYHQLIKERFCVRVFLSKSAKNVLQSYDEITEVKHQLMAALCGYNLSDSKALLIEYDSGGGIVAITKGYYVIDFFFSRNNVLESGNFTHPETYLDKKNFKELKSLHSILFDRESQYQSEIEINLKKTSGA